MDDNNSFLVQNIENAIDKMIEQTDEEMNENYSDYISTKLGYDYTYLANIFSEVKGINIHHHIIISKIEKVKELIIYNKITLTEIAARMHYSSVAHLSNQFKKVTGHTPTFYKKLKRYKRENIENLRFM